MTHRMAALCAAVSLAAASLAAPALGQGIAGSGELSGAAPGYGGGFGILAEHALAHGVGDPLGFKESTPRVTGGPPALADPDVEYTKGFTDFQLGKYRQASQEFEIALSVRPRDKRALFLLGLSLANQGDYVGALGAYEKAMALDDAQIAFHSDYAIALAKLGRLDRAKAQYALLKSRAEECAGACPLAKVYSAELNRVQSAMTEAPKQYP